MYPHAPPPRIDPSELRPKRRWYVVAVVIGAVVVLAGVGGFVYGVVTAATAGGIGERFPVGETATVRLAPQPQPAIYVSELDDGHAPSTECTVTSTTGDEVRVTRPSFAFTYTRGGTTWHLRYLVHAPAPGEYRVSCRPTSGNVSTEHAMGQAPRTEQFFGGLFGGLASLFVLPAIGLAVGGTLAIVVGTRRSNHRRRLQAARAQSGPYPPPGTA